MQSLGPITEMRFLFVANPRLRSSLLPTTQAFEPVPKPRDFPIEIARPRILDAFAWFDYMPVRILCAPNGGGKSTALLQYAAQRSGVASMTLPRDATSIQVTRLLAGAEGAREVVIDEVDAASPSGLEALFEEIDANHARGRRYMLGGSSRARMQVQRFLPRGIAELFDASLLAFTSAEIGELAAAHGVAGDEIDVEQLKYETDGWPVAVAWIIRDAARAGHSLRGAFEQWRDRNGHLLVEFVALAQRSGESAEAFMSAIRSVPDPASQRTLERLEADGYPVVRMRASLRPYRVLTRLVRETPEADTALPIDDRLVLKLFGRFSCKVRNQAVTFARRRDQNLLAFVALARGASVTRSEVLAAFWPDAPAAVASQGLRTTLSRLRRAIAEAAGCDADRYLRADGRIALDLDRVSIDVRRFADHIECARLEDARGKGGAARDHYLQAERLYADALLSSEAVEPALAPRVAEYGEMFELALVRLVEMYAQENDIQLGSAYARRLATLSGEVRERRELAVRLQSSISTA